MKLALGVAHAAFVLAAIALFAEFGQKLTMHENNLKTTASNPGIANVVLGSIGLALLLWTVFCWSRHSLTALSSRQWAGRRRRLTLLVAAELAVQLVNILAFILPNGGIVADACYQWQAWILGLSTIVRWTCWNTLFFLICVHAHNVNPWRPGGAEKGNAEGLESLVINAPLSVHWSKGILWVGMEIVVALSAWLGISSTYQDVHDSSAASSVADCADQEASCELPHGLYITVALMVAFSGIWFCLWLFLIYRAKRHLLNLPYADFKFANMFLRLQERSRWVFVVFFTISLALLWFVNNRSCFSMAFTWLGLLPCQILATLNICVWAYMMCPLPPGQDTPMLQVELQRFAWTQSQHDQVQKARQLQGLQGHSLPPLFCVQTAFAGLYWSGLVYDSHEAEGMEAKMGWGYELLGLDQHELIWEHRLDTKVLLGWGPGGIAVAFRGTASLRNALSDLQVWRSDHPPVRGSRMMWQRPVVHSGFLRCWLEDGLNQRVVQRVLALAAAWEADHPGHHVPVLVTGHSLGGALSDLAAYDIAQAAAAAGAKLRLACYTYGAPRVGNHAYARDHAQVVPDTWGVINDQDVVARRGKLWVLYKRSGHRVIINTRGDLIVRPTYAEANVQRVPGGGSISQHYLGGYQRALLAVCLAQFSAKRYKEGMQGVMALALAAQPLQALFCQELNLTPADMQDLARASEASPEKWSHVRRKRMGARSGPPGKWQDAAAAAALSPISPSTALVPLASPLSTQADSLIAASAAPGLHSDGSHDISDLKAATTDPEAATNRSDPLPAGGTSSDNNRSCAIGASSGSDSSSSMVSHAAEVVPPSQGSDMVEVSIAQEGMTLQQSGHTQQTHADQAGANKAVHPSSPRAGLRARLQQLLFGKIDAQLTVMH
ncbi:hypothetical protein WJX74_001662 [Apatococcus lobatus]|uniref:Fungal lipase-type domain-containing protein n=1 Tax=Apatococcus lobatus TaxID=904363 RepID=A0AAW1QK70_9CHLO